MHGSLPPDSPETTVFFQNTAEILFSCCHSPDFVVPTKGEAVYMFLYLFFMSLFLFIFVRRCACMGVCMRAP